MIATLTPIIVGNYVNFSVDRVKFSNAGTRKYIKKSFLGKVVSISDRNKAKTYKIMIRSRKGNECFDVPRYRIHHVWYVV